MPFFYEPHYMREARILEGHVSMIQPSERDVLMVCQNAEIRAAHRQVEEDEGGMVMPSQRRSCQASGGYERPRSLRELPKQAEPYGQAGAQAATTMRITREIDGQSLRLEHQYWEVQEVEDLCHAVLQRVQDDTKARRAAGQKPQVLSSPPHRRASVDTCL